MSDLHEAVRQTWERALDADHAVSPPDVARKVIEDFPALVKAEEERLIFAAIVREIKAIARLETEQSSQLSLFGFPSVIAIPQSDEDEGDFAYMRTTKAVWGELEAGATVRETNVRRAQEKLDTYRAALEHVRPRMQGTGLTFAEFLREQP